MDNNLKMEKINQSDLVEGGYYKYIFSYDSYQKGIALIRWSKKGNFPWLPLHKPGEFFYNSPCTNNRVIFETLTGPDRKWLKVCIYMNKFIHKEEIVNSNVVFNKESREWTLKTKIEYTREDKEWSPVTKKKINEIYAKLLGKQVLNEEKDKSLDELLRDVD